MGRNNKRWHKKPQSSGEGAYTPPYGAETLQMSVDGLNLSAPTLEILKKGGIHTVGDIVKRRKNDMYKVQNFNKKKLFEVINAIAPLKVDFRPDEAPKAQLTEPNREAPQRIPENKGKVRQDGQQPSRPDKQGRAAPDRSESDRQRPHQEERRETPKNDKPKQDNGREKQGKNKKEGNGVDFSRIFPREKLVYSPRIMPEKDRFVKFQRAGKWGFKDENGKEVIPPIYNEALNFKEDMAAVEMNGLFGYINRENVLVIPYKYDTAGSFSEGWANVCLGEKCGYIDKSGKETVPFIYDAATAFTGEGYGRVKKDGRWGNIRKNGEVTWQ